MRLPHFIIILLLSLGFLASQAIAAADVQLVMESDRRLYKADATSEFFVETTISATHIANASASPATARSVTLVLDQSGSMAGDRISALRLALDDVIAGLSAQDILSVVAFGSEVKTLVPANRVDRIRDLTTPSAQLEPAGGSALYDALSQGAAQARRFAGSANSHDLILVTDGPATKGPREPDDFTNLVKSLSTEGIRVSTIGLGGDFEEDLLASLARAGNGRFILATAAADLRPALATFISRGETVIARDLVLTLQFRGFCDELTAHGSLRAESTSSSLTFHIPYLTAGQSISALSSARIWNSYAATGHQTDVVTANLTWTSPDADSVPSSQATTSALPLRFVADADLIKESIQIGAFRRAVDALISEGMQDTIEQMDKGNLKRALQIMRKTRNQVAGLASELEDDGLNERLAHLDLYLAEVEARGLDQLDRKILRSGLENRFDSPVPQNTP